MDGVGPAAGSAGLQQDPDPAGEQLGRPPVAPGDDGRARGQRLEDHPRQPLAVAGGQQHRGVGHPPGDVVGAVDEVQPRTGPGQVGHPGGQRALADDDQVQGQALSSALGDGVHGAQRVLVGVQVPDEERVGPLGQARGTPAAQGGVAVLLDRDTGARQVRQDPGPQGTRQAAHERLVRRAHRRERQRAVRQRTLEEPHGQRLRTPLTGLEVEPVDDVDRAPAGTRRRHHSPQDGDDRRLHLHQVPVPPAQRPQVPGQPEQGAGAQAPLGPDLVEGAPGVTCEQAVGPRVAGGRERDRVPPVAEHPPGLRALQRQAPGDGGDGQCLPRCLPHGSS